ncbi:EPIDERMAL PATTERNING FACTOR-like protein 1 [Platanthera guangdongensis]|uniref:Epidermal patterning factor-like protein n=1 Tax=Platanthera guangdongensis TaxID=2320717 RepID=A0ABR2LIJ9_9ASPA
MSSVIMSHVLLATALLHFLLLHNSVSSAGKYLRPLLTSPPPLQVITAAAEEEKIRLGSTPPSCHNRCNACNPCRAVQIPTMAGQTDRLGQIDVSGRRRPPDQLAYGLFSSNYKPLGWRCGCGARLFNP